jgi:hypothetical protein
MTVYEEIRAERRRQIHVEGFGPTHDAQHRDGSLAQAAACYAAGNSQCYQLPEWPPSWHTMWDKREKHPRRRQLIIAAALCVAEIQRLDPVPCPDEFTKTTRWSASSTPPLGFWECETCRSKPGMAELCESCLHNRAAIEQLKRSCLELRVADPAELGAAPDEHADEHAARSWAIVELYGHQRLAGQISQAAFPEGFVQINTVQGPTRTYNPKAVFGLAWVTEKAARAAVTSCDDPAPVKPWENRQQDRIDKLRLTLQRVARGEASPCSSGSDPSSVLVVDLAEKALAADDALTDDPTGVRSWADEEEVPM